MGATYTWNGAALKSASQQAIVGGLEETAAAAVAPAQAATPVKTGLARGSISFRPAERQGGLWVVFFGSFDVIYFIWLEIGANGRAGIYMLRHAVDQVIGSLPQRIKGRMP